MISSRPVQAKNVSTRREPTKGLSPSAEKADSGGKAKPARLLEKPEDEYSLYVSIRKPADDAMSEGEYSRARKLYVRGASEIEKLQLEADNRLSAMYAGAASCARACNRYLLSIKHLRQSFENLKEKDYWFINTLSYVVDQIHALPYYIKTPEQKKQLNSLKKEMYERFKSHIEEIPSPKHFLVEPYTYQLNQETIRDDFRFLEDIHSEDSEKWLKSEREYSKSFFQLALLNYELPSEYFRPDRQQANLIPFRYGKYYYFRHVDSSTRHRSIRRSLGTSDRRRLILSGERVCPTGHFVTGERVSENGEFIAYGISKHGSDWEKWFVRYAESGKRVPGLQLDIRHGGIMFHPDGKGLVYWKQDKPEKDDDQLQKIDKSVLIHYRPIFPPEKLLDKLMKEDQASRKAAKAKAGGKSSENGRNRKKLAKGEKSRSKISTRIAKQAQSMIKEKLVHFPNDPAVDRVGLQYVMDGRYALIHERKKGATKSKCYLRPERSRSKELIPLFAGRSVQCSYINWFGNQFFFLSNEGAPNGKIVSIALSTDKKKALPAEVLLPEDKSKVISEVYLVEGMFIVNYLVDRSTRSEISCFGIDGSPLGQIPLPFEGIVDSLSCNFDDNNVFFTISNFANASTICLHNLKTHKTRVFMPPTGSPCRDLVSKVVEVKSKDGAIVPMWLVHRKSVKLGPQAPTLMMVYGGFNVPCLPYCNYEILSWTEMGGVWAQPYLRGGGELGEDWHLQAQKLKKQNTFDDAIACARYLVEHKLSSQKKLAIKGGSNGGLTVGAVINQAPELFAAAVSSNGLFDMMKFQNHTIGWAWESEYGSIRKRAEFDALLKYSPYHNIDPGKKYPALLLCANAGDDRVPPWHTYKFAYAMRDRLNSTSPEKTSPLLLRVEDDSGHENQRSSWEIRDQQAFLKWVLDF